MFAESKHMKFSVKLYNLWDQHGGNAPKGEEEGAVCWHLTVYNFWMIFLFWQLIYFWLVMWRVQTAQIGITHATVFLLIPIAEVFRQTWHRCVSWSINILPYKELVFGVLGYVNCGL